MKVSVVNNSFIPLAIKVRHNQSSVSPYWTRSTRPKEGINPFVASFRLRAIPNAKQKDTGKYMTFHMFVMNQSQCAMQHTSTRRQRLAHTITNGSQATCVHIQVYECLYILLVFLLFVSSAPQFASTHIVRARTSTTISIRVVRVARNRARNAVSCASTHIVYTYRVERRKKKNDWGRQYTPRTVVRSMRRKIFRRWVIDMNLMQWAVCVQDENQEKSHSEKIPIHLQPKM